MIRPLIALTLLAGCTTPSADAPSLLPRPIESRSDAEPAPVEATPAPDAALDAEIASAVAGFDAAAQAFDVGTAAAEAKLGAARGAAEGSERWLDGQTAIGELQQLRSASETAITRIEQLAIARASAGLLPYPALDSAIAAAQARLDRQAVEEARLIALAGG